MLQRNLAHSRSRPRYGRISSEKAATHARQSKLSAFGAYTNTSAIIDTLHAGVISTLLMLPVHDTATVPGGIVIGQSRPSAIRSGLPSRYTLARRDVDGNF
jgi:hypothetical protein